MTSWHHLNGLIANSGRQGFIAEEPASIRRDLDADILEKLRAALSGRIEGNPAKIEISCQLDLSISPQARLHPVVEAIKGAYNKAGAHTRIEDVTVLADVSGMKEAILGQEGLTNTTHIALLSISGGETVLAVLKIFGGECQNLRGKDGQVVETTPFETGFQRLKEGHGEFPKLYGEFTNTESQRVEGMLCEYIVGPDLESALLSGLVTWDEGIELVMRTLVDLRLAGFDTWDRVANNYIVTGFSINPDSVQSFRPRDWRWSRPAESKLGLTLVDTDSVVTAEDPITEGECLSESRQEEFRLIAEEILLGMKASILVESAIQQKRIPSDSIAVLCLEYSNYLEENGLKLGNPDMEGNKFILVPLASGQGYIMRGGSLTFDSVSSFDDSLPSLSPDQVYKALSSYLTDLATQAMPSAF